MTKKPPHLTRRKLATLPRESIHKARNWSKADVSIAEWPPGSGDRVVIKELKNRPLWFRVLAGRYLLRREWRALCALKDLPGVPKPIARPDTDTIVMEFCPGRPIEKMKSFEVPDEAIDKLEHLVKIMHSRGITHGDLHGYNILVEDSGDISVIDWATASTFSSRRNGVKSFSFAEWQALDERALAKVKILCAPLEMTPRQHDLLLHGGSSLYRVTKKFKHALERVKGGVDDERSTQRARKQQMYEERLKKYDPSAGDEERLHLQQKIERKKQRRQQRAAQKEAEPVE